MATGGPPLKCREWQLDNLYTVAVFNENPENSNAKLILDCYVTDRLDVGLKFDKRPGRCYIQFPLPSPNQTQSPETLRETFEYAMGKYVHEEDNVIAVSIDDLKNWGKSKFCETLLESFCSCSVLKAERKPYPVKLLFCSLDGKNFDTAVEACDKVLKTLRSSSDNRKSHIDVEVVKGNLDETEADALACTVAASLDLMQGAVSKALSKKDGRSLQIELEKRYSEDTAFGEITVVSAKKLPCKYVLFGVMWRYDEELGKKYASKNEYYQKSVNKFVTECLKEAERKCCKSVAFPAVGAGNLEYPVDIVAEQMFSTVMNWCERPRKSSIEKITFVVFPEDHIAVQEFENAKRRHSTDNMKVSPSDVTAKRSVMNTNTGAVSLKTTTFQRENPNQMEESNRLKTEKVKCKMKVGIIAFLIPKLSQNILDKLKDTGCDLEITDDSVTIMCHQETMETAVKQVTDTINDLEKRFPVVDTLDLTKSTKFREVDVRKKVAEIGRKTSIVCVLSGDGQVYFFGKKDEDLQNAKQEVLDMILPKREKMKGEMREESPMGARPKEAPKTDEKSGNNNKFSNKFSWSQHSKGFSMYITKEKIEVKVYSADIIKAPVDCIVNAANTNLDHAGGIAKAIAKAAGKDLNKEGCAYLKKHGKLKVGEACSTIAGKMPYVCVIHAVGPCWNDYKPYTLKDVEKCEKDLYNAVINSLAEAEKKGLQTIAVSSISSGVYGCPHELCSMQYAKAVLNYSKMSKSPLLEIHFVDTNMDMVRIIQDTFKSMIPNERTPTFYNKSAYVRGTSNSKPSKQGSADFKHQGQNAGKQGQQRFEGAMSHFPCIHLTMPAGQTTNQFTCTVGDGQNLYIYTDNILSLEGSDIIVCGNNPNGKTKGKLAAAIDQKGGKSYMTEKEKAFKKVCVLKGEVILCKSGNLKNFKWVGHAILFQLIDCRGEDDRKQKVNSVFCKIFQAMQGKYCHSLALPLVGTGEGHADPEYSATRFIESLLEFVSFNSKYKFSIHLVHKEEGKTRKAIEVISKYIEKVIKLKDKGRNKDQNSQFSAHRPTSAHTKLSPQSQFQNERVKGYSSVDSRRGKGHGNRFSPSRSESHQWAQSTINRHEEDMNKRQHSSRGKNHASRSNIVRRSEEDEPEDKMEVSAQLSSAESMDEKSLDEEVSGTSNSIASQSLDEAKKKEGNLPIFDDTPQEQLPSNLKGTDDRSDSSDSDGASDAGISESEIKKEEEIETCVICMEDITDPKKLPCGHVFCHDCIQEQFSYKEVCPTCGKVCGIITGDQPHGKMDVFVNDREYCAGYEKYGRIEIIYTFPEGKQGPNHPAPGTRIKGITRKAYLPKNRKGKEILEMLKIAFERKLVFTIGRSRTTGAEGVITWNDIHHKTDPRPNNQFGYPDPTYLDRVTDELKVKGVTLNDIPTISVSRHGRR